MSTTNHPLARTVSPTLLGLAGLALAVLGVGGYLIWWATAGLVREGNWIGLDFHVYYVAAQVLRRGGDIYNSGMSPQYVYSPFLAAAVIPLTWLPDANTATLTWKVLQNAGLLGSGALLVSLLPRRGRLLGAGGLLFGLLTVPVRDEIYYGESNSLVLVLVVGAIWLLARGRGLGVGGWGLGTRDQGSGIRDQGRESEWALSPVAVGAGVLLALAVSIKVLPVLLVAYLWWRGPRGVAAVATGGFVLIQAGLFALTPTTADYWLIHFPALFGEAFPYLDNQSLNAAIARALLPGTDPALPPLQLADGAALRPLVTLLANGLAVIVAIAALAPLRRPAALPPGPSRTTGFLLEMGLVLLTIHLVSGSTWLHHLIDLAVVVIGVGGWGLGAGAGGRGGGGRRLIAVAAAVIGGGLAVLLWRPGEWVRAIDPLVPNGPLLAWIAANAALWVVIAYWLLAARLLWVTRTLPTPRPPPLTPIP
jgi:hypothetical protein